MLLRRASPYRNTEVRTLPGGKVYHRFRLDNLAHRCARVGFPSNSLAQVQVLADGNVIPHIVFYPARAASEVATVVRRELRYSLARKSPAVTPLNPCELTNHK